MTDVQAPPAIDLLDPTFWRDRQHDAWRWARANDPVHRDEKNGLWAVTRHADVLHAERHDEIFSSHRTYRVNETPTESNIIASDDPKHVNQRRLVNRGFTPRAVREQSPIFEAMIQEMVDDATPDSGSGTVEVVDALAGRLPARFTCWLLGIPDERWPEVKVWSEKLMRIDSMLFDNDAATGLFEVTSQLFDLVSRSMTELRGCPHAEAQAAGRAGLLHTWANATLDDELLDLETVFHETGLFVAGGAETTRTAIAHGLRAFADHPEQWERLAAEPELLPSAVDEVVRYVTPLNNMFRKALVDTELGGVPIAAGDRLALVYPSANRDEDVFEDPDTFDITRSPNPHVAFGHGTHFCLGANFARKELELLFGALTQRWRNLRVVEELDVEANIFAPAARSLTLGFDLR